MRKYLNRPIYAGRMLRYLLEVDTPNGRESVYCHRCGNIANNFVCHERAVGNFNIPVCGKHSPIPAGRYINAPAYFTGVRFFVDPMHGYQGRGAFCHLMTDGTIEDLHYAAEQIGVNRCWFHNPKGKGHPHYDLRAHQREIALELGVLGCASTKVMLQRLAVCKAVKAREGDPCQV